MAAKRKLGRKKSLLGRLFGSRETYRVRGAAHPESRKLRAAERKERIEESQARTAEVRAQAAEDKLKARDAKQEAREAGAKGADYDRLKKLIDKGMTLREAADSIGLKLNKGRFVAGKCGRTKRRVNKAKKRGGARGSSKMAAIKTLTKRLLQAGVPIALFNGKMKRNPQRSPSRAAEEAFEEFHGRPSSGVLEFSRPVRYHGATADLGELIELKIRVPAIRGGGVVKVAGFCGARLTRSPKGSKPQLFVEGGDQKVSLKAFGISGGGKELEKLGQCVEVTYFTTKDHLGRDGGTANYVHKFGGERGEPKTELPDIGYDSMNKQLLFLGGGYSIPPEGIDG